ncbi:NAD(P)(+) transhydrogenase (Re/Si-specific) [Lentibacillus sp. JNUCC-1]|uniref:alanine dehydrogenase n=1 Tax=Lentibacillus sp. JNUCC-1 TaxID=2654513 RepID=UPI0012E90CCF|nr:alanine dehydrogenase [Lentibacillus sp. JNUCC-1]MUV36959.1 NAD(P)(+) transhydrogenase (Re/Si-specific) [Lentibacillus sp. JNUCC-1]
MEIGIPKEIKESENRVAITPSGVVTLTNAGHEVFLEAGAGTGAGFSDEAYSDAGAVIVSTAAEAWKKQMVMKVKEPLPEEYDYFYDGLILFTFLHLAANPDLTKALIEKNVVGLAYETVQLPDRSLPLLTPMSEIAGNMATQIGAQFLEKPKGGKGILLSGIPGVKRGKVTVIGGGVVGMNAAKVASNLGAEVSIIDLNPARLRTLSEMFGSSVNTIMSNAMNIANEVKDSDLVVGSVLIPGAKAPVLVTEDMIRDMSEGSVIVDVAIDQGGNFETSDRITSHDEPVFVKHGVLHYTVANIPGAVPRTGTIGLANVSVPYALQIAEKGYKQACLDNPALMKGLNTLQGKVTFKGVSESLDLPYDKAEHLLG